MTLSELKRLLRGWDRMSTDRRARRTATRANNVYHHYDRHGIEATVGEYLRGAGSFSRLHAKAVIRDDGTTLYKRRDGRFLITRTASDRIVSHGLNY